MLVPTQCLESTISSKLKSNPTWHQLFKLNFLRGYIELRRQFPGRRARERILTFTWSYPKKDCFCGVWECKQRSGDFLVFSASLLLLNLYGPLAGGWESQWAWIYINMNAGCHSGKGHGDGTVTATFRKVRTSQLEELFWRWSFLLHTVTNISDMCHRWFKTTSVLSGCLFVKRLGTYHSLKKWM